MVRKRKINGTDMDALYEHGELRSQGSVNYSDIDKANDAPKDAAKTRSRAKGKSSKNILMVLVVMVALTWAVAATAYFGIIDYKGLLDKPKYIDKRRSVASNVPLKSNVCSLETSSNMAKKDTDQVEKKDIETEKPQEPSTQKAQPEKNEAIKDKSATKTSSTDASKQKTKAKKNSPEKKTQDVSLFNSANDQPILKELATGEALLEKKKGKEATNFFKKLLASNPDSPRAIYGRARAIMMVAELERSNALLSTGIEALSKVTDHPRSPPALMKAAAMLQIDKYIFLGKMGEQYKVAAALYKKLPNDIEVLNKFGVAYLYIGKMDRAKKIFEQALKVNPRDGFALTHFGFVLKNEGDWVEGARYLQIGIESMEEGTQEGKFYMHLGDALHRTNRTDEAKEIYRLGAERGLFLSQYQRSLYNVDRLKSKPFWTAKEAKATSYVNALEKNWKIIRDEALKIMDIDKGVFHHEEESLKNTGEWKQLTLFARGQEQNDCKRLPKTCALVKTMPNAIGCRRGQVKYSIMAPGTHVWAHTGPTNCRLRMHLGLIIPKTGQGAKIRCAEKYRTWEEGKVMIFDDSFEHEVWQNADSHRLIMIMDIWHPDLTEHEKRTLTPI